METREFVQRKNNHFLWTMKIVPEVWWIYQDLGLLNKKRPVLGLYLSKQAGSGLFAKMRPSVAALYYLLVLLLYRDPPWPGCHAAL